MPRFMRCQTYTYYIFAILVFCCFYNDVSGNSEEYFSSVTGLEGLLNVEIIMLDDLQRYIDSMQAHINMLQSQVDSIRLEYSTVSDDIDGYLSNPVNAYRLIKRLQNDWSMTEETVRLEASRDDFLSAMQENRQNYNLPTKEDVVGAALGLARLQDTYKLNVAEISNGILNGNKYGSPMSWQDCFHIGQQLYEVNDFSHTKLWLNQSMELLKSEEYTSDPIVVDFMETVVAYYQSMGDYETALDLVHYILNIDAGREEIADIKTDLERLIGERNNTRLIHETTSWDYHLTEDFKRYELVCRGELFLTANEQRQLKCRIDSNQLPFRLLQPFKVEQHSLDPLILQIHDVFSPDDANAIKQMAKTRMSRSEVRSSDDATTMKPDSYRICKGAWFAYNETERLQKILRYMADISGLNMESAEQLQVNNYGIGGHYEPHFDFFAQSQSSLLPDGDRIATGIFYFSDVQEGGGTAFPHLRVLIKPQHGSVLFWYNLHRSGEPDYRTRHAACPVLKGSKWVGNVWIRERHQDRQRPCGYAPDHDISLKYKNLS